MKLSTRSTYGMRALVEIALMGGRGPVSAAMISRRQDLSVAYLEQLLHRLKKDGMVSSIRGPRGGYVLSREAGRITVGDIVRVLDGTNGQAQAKGRNGHRRASGPKEMQRYAQHIALAVQHCVHERLAQSLNEVTLQDLCDEVNTAAGEPLEHRYVFHI